MKRFRIWWKERWYIAAFKCGLVPETPDDDASDRNRMRRFWFAIRRGWDFCISFIVFADDEPENYENEGNMETRDSGTTPPTGAAEPSSTTTETDASQSDKTKKFPTIAVGIILALTLTAIMVAIGFWMTRTDGDKIYSTPFSFSSASAAHETNATPTPNTYVSGATTTDEFVIDMPRRDGHRLNADGVKKRGNAEAFRDQIAEQAKHDPLTLYLYYQASPLGRKKPLPNEAALAEGGLIVNGNKFSELGIQAYKDWLFLWELADIKATDEIRFQGSNTGVNGTQTSRSNGVSGKDKSGYDIAYRDATDKKVSPHSALNRCTQPTGKVPGVHKGPTDNPLQPKNWRQDPFPQGNAPIGGGPNETSGPGEYIPPEEMERPGNTPRPNPTTPAPVPSGSATPDPQPTPPEETGAPNPDDPAS